MQGVATGFGGKADFWTLGTGYKQRRVARTKYFDYLVNSRTGFEMRFSQESNVAIRGNDWNSGAVIWLGKKF
jgi:hypothetical protein